MVRKLLSFAIVLLLAAPVFAGDSPVPVTLSPDAAETLKKQGKPFRPDGRFPNYVNRSHKFNPGGEVVGPMDPARTTGNQNMLVLFVTFQGGVPGLPATRVDLAQFDDLLFGATYWPPEYTTLQADSGLVIPDNRTLKNYYLENSYGQTNIVTLNPPSSQGWIELPNSYDYYVAGCNGFCSYPRNAQKMVEDAVLAADATIDFSAYAIDGVVPNLMVVFAGGGAEWNGGWNQIWSHSWSTRTPVAVDGVQVIDYAMMPEVGGDTVGLLGPARVYPATLGVFAHEYGHVLGLPDQYDYGYESEGTAIYSMMAGGSWNRYPNLPALSGNSPSHFDAWSKMRLSWVTPVEITDAQSLSLPAVQFDPVVYRMNVPYSGGKEYYLFENRQQVGFDQGLKRRNAKGLAIYHIDDVVMTRNYWRPNEAENWKEFRSLGDQKSWTGERHYGISLIQADDRWDNEHGVYWMAFEDDLYPGLSGTRTEFSSYTLPNSSSYYFWGGSAPKFGWSGVTVKNITETGGVINADFSFVPWTGKK